MKEKIKSLINNTSLHRYFGNTAWVVLDKIIRMSIGIFVTIALGRFLGPIKFGVLNYIIAYVGVFSTVTFLGLNEIIISEIVMFPENKNKIKGTVFYLILFASILTLITISCSLFVNRNEHQTNLYIIILSLSMIFQPFYVIDFYFQSQVLSKYSVSAQFASLIITSVLKLILIQINASLFYFVLVILLESIIISLSLLYVYFKKTRYSLLDWKFEKTLAISMLKKSWPIILSSVSIAIYMRIDQIMLKNILGFEAVGNFSVAVKLTELWYFVPMSIGASFFPALINAKKINETIFNSRFLNLMTIMVIISLSITIITVIFSNQIIVFLYGSSYIKSVQVLNIYIWASIFVFLGVVSSKWFIIEDLNKISFIRSLFGAIANISLNFILIPMFGINGAAISTLISYSIQVYFSNLFFRKTRNLFYMQTNALFLIYPIKFLLTSLKNKI